MDHDINNSEVVHWNRWFYVCRIRRTLVLVLLVGNFAEPGDQSCRTMHRGRRTRAYPGFGHRIEGDY